LAFWSGFSASHAWNAGTNSGRKRRWYRLASVVLPSVVTSSQRLKFSRSWIRFWPAVVETRVAVLRAAFDWA
jgi:hypothetical protein